MGRHGRYFAAADSFELAAPHGGDEDEWRRWVEGMPISEALGLRCLRLGGGIGSFRIDEVPITPNPNGSIHGGLLVAAADQCMGSVAMTVLEPGLLPVTATIHSQYHRPAMTPATLEARVTKRGASLVFVDVDVTDPEGQLCNSSQGTMMIMERG